MRSGSRRMERLGEWNQAQENQKGCWAATRDQVTSANTALLSPTHLAQIVTFPSKREMMPRGRDRVEGRHSPKLRTGKAGMAVTHGAASMWDSRRLELVLLSGYVPCRAQCRQVSSNRKWERVTGRRRVDECWSSLQLGMQRVHPGSRVGRWTQRTQS